MTTGLYILAGVLAVVGALIASVVILAGKAARTAAGARHAEQEAEGWKEAHERSRRSPVDRERLAALGDRLRRTLDRS